LYIPRHAQRDQHTLHMPNKDRVALQDPDHIMRVVAPPGGVGQNAKHDI
jgi:hypothetical protein